MSTCSEVPYGELQALGVDVVAIFGVQETTTGRLGVSRASNDLFRADRKPVDLTKLTVVCAERYYKRRVMRGQGHCQAQKNRY